jgi:hypothetical protein
MKDFHSAFKGTLCTLVITLLCLVSASGQKISGSVQDAVSGRCSPAPLIVVQGTTRGTASDASGNFVLDARKGEVLVVSDAGYKTQTTAVGDAATIVILMSGDNVLNEVTVGALGISREKIARLCSSGSERKRVAESS